MRDFGTAFGCEGRRERAISAVPENHLDKLASFAEGQSLVRANCAPIIVPPERFGADEGGRVARPLMTRDLTIHAISPNTRSSFLGGTYRDRNGDLRL